MAGLRPTAARLALMRAINNGDVTYHRNWGHDPNEYRWGRKTVTGQCSLFEQERLIRLGAANGPSIYSPRAVELTDAGRTWLAEHDEETK